MSPVGFVLMGFLNVAQMPQPAKASRRSSGYVIVTLLRPSYPAALPPGGSLARANEPSIPQLVAVTHALPLPRGFLRGIACLGSA